jgi:hypothetical protein
VCTPSAQEYQVQYPTEGDLARVQLHRRGYLYSGDVLEQVKNGLARLDPQARKAFALARAESLMRHHEGLPGNKQSLFALSWRPVLDAMWLTLADIQSTGLRRASQALEDFQRGPFFPSPELGGPADADEDAAAASIFAAECFVSGEAAPAAHAAARCMDAVLALAAERLQLNYDYFEWSPDAAEPTPWVRAHMQPAVQMELKRQLAQLDLLEQHGATRSVVERLRG